MRPFVAGTWLGIVLLPSSCLLLPRLNKAVCGAMPLPDPCHTDVCKARESLQPRRITPVVVSLDMYFSERCEQLSHTLCSV